MTNFFTIVLPVFASVFLAFYIGWKEGRKFEQKIMTEEFLIPLTNRLLEDFENNLTKKKCQPKKKSKQQS